MSNIALLVFVAAKSLDFEAEKILIQLLGLKVKFLRLILCYLQLYNLFAALDIGEWIKEVNKINTLLLFIQVRLVLDIIQWMAFYLCYRLCTFCPVANLSIWETVQFRICTVVTEGNFLYTISNVSNTLDTNFVTQIHFRLGNAFIWQSNIPFHYGKILINVL